MRLEKAREFYSDYFEGTLDNGLIQTFEHVLSDNPTIQQDYDSFVRTMDSLDIFKSESIEAPMFLSDRIATRLEQTVKKPKGLFSNLRGWAVGFAGAGLATLAIYSAWMNIGKRGDTTKADIIGSPSSESESVTVALEKGVVVFRYRATGAHKINVALASGQSLKQIGVENRTIDLPLENPNTSPAVFRIEISGEKHPMFVAVPGSKLSTGRTGQGTVLEFASAVAGGYKVPVIIDVSEISKRIDWKFDANARASVAASVQRAGFGFEQLKDDMFKISDR